MKRYSLLLLVIIIFLVGGLSTDTLPPQRPREAQHEMLETIISTRPWVGLCATEEPQRSIEAARQEIKSTPHLATFFAEWPLEQLYYRRITEPMRAYVAYQRGARPIAWTRKLAQLRVGETLLCVNQDRCMRQHCCNAVSWLPQLPMLPPENEPPAEWLQPPDVPPTVDEFPPDVPSKHAGPPPLIGDRPPEYWRSIFLPPAGPEIIVPPAVIVPEPETWIMVGSGVVLMVVLRIKRKKRHIYR